MGALDPVAVQIDDSAWLSLENSADGPKIAEIVRQLKVQAGGSDGDWMTIATPHTHTMTMHHHTRSATKISVWTTMDCLGCGPRTGLADYNYFALVML